MLGQNGYLMIQALVDSQGKFMDVSAGWPSSMKPEFVLRQAKLFASVEELKEVLNGPSFGLMDGDFLPRYILGASCFPLLPWLFTPYVKRVRASWGLLIQRWKDSSVEFLPFVIITGCLLHNFLIHHGETPLDDAAAVMKEQKIAVYYGEGNDSSQRIRDVLALHLIRVSKPR
ncbi:hypothetical protein Nepgr_032514 [Nepenthes gracilis]|uniref:DDE Tnp4 domain-containing protein n=1 Tax=Nepenthes gracilis TaxID=150966 RepID=A0AAD3TK76_NEPGR|nr:hypothetical protein Nepgr_032514 [Nepenthes gracilis]